MDAVICWKSLHGFAKAEINPCHRPLRHLDTQNGLFSQKRPFFLFFCFYSPQIMFFQNNMTSNAFLQVFWGLLDMHVTQPPLFTHFYNSGCAADECCSVVVVVWTSPVLFYNPGCIAVDTWLWSGCGLDMIIMHGTLVLCILALTPGLSSPREIPQWTLAHAWRTTFVLSILSLAPSLPSPWQSPK